MASAAVTRLWITVRDAAGRVAKTAIQLALTEYDPTGTLAAAWKILVKSIMVGTSKVVKLTTTQFEALDNSGVTGPRANREDKVTADLPDVNQVVHTYRIPTPAISIGQSGGSDKLDLTDTAVLAWVSAMTANAVTSDGVAFAGTITGGRFIRNKPEKKGGY